MNGKMQDFNQRLSEAGLPAYVPDTDTERAAEQLADRLCATDSTLERFASNRWPQAIGAEITERWHTEQFNRAALYLDPVTDTHHAPDYDEADPDTHERHYLVADLRGWLPEREQRPMCRIPLARCEDYHDVARTKLAHITRCQMRASVFCRPESGTKIFGIKRGENICVAKACTACRDEWLALPDPGKYAAREFGPIMTRPYNPKRYEGQYPETAVKSAREHFGDDFLRTLDED